MKIDVSAMYGTDRQLDWAADILAADGGAAVECTPYQFTARMKALLDDNPSLGADRRILGRYLHDFIFPNGHVDGGVIAHMLQSYARYATARDVIDRRGRNAHYAVLYASGVLIP